MRQPIDSAASGVITFELAWHEGGAGDDVADRDPDHRYRRTVDVRWIPEVGEIVHLTDNGTVQLSVERIEWQVDGTPLLILEPWIAPDPPSWAEAQGFTRVAT